MRPPAIRDARKLCKDLGARGVIVLAFDAESFAGASYGDTKAECSSLGGLLDDICGDLTNGDLVVSMRGAPASGAPPRWECAACGRAREDR